MLSFSKAKRTDIHLVISFSDWLQICSKRFAIPGRQSSPSSNRSVLCYAIHLYHLILSGRQLLLPRQNSICLIGVFRVAPAEASLPVEIDGNIHSYYPPNTSSYRLIIQDISVIWHCLASNDVIPAGCLKNRSSLFISASSKALLPFDNAACIQFHDPEAARFKVTADIPISWVSVSSHDILTIGSPMNWKQHITTTAALSPLALESIYKPRRLWNLTIFIQTFWSVCAGLVSFNNFHSFL